jgi:hypothetical protein
VYPPQSALAQPRRPGAGTPARSRLSEVDHDLVVLAFFAVIAFEPGSQATGLHADDGVGPGVEGCLAAENLDTNRVFLEVVALSLECLARDERDEVLQAVRGPERDARRNPLDLVAHLAFRGRGHAHPGDHFHA